MSQLKERLSNIYKHNLAAVEVYKGVIKHVSDEKIRNTLGGFLNDHERHLSELREYFDKNKGEKPSDWRDLKGVLLDVYTSLLSLTGEKGALKALHTAENIVLRQYKEEEKEHHDDDMAKIIKKQLKDEEKHRDYLESIGA